MLAQEVNAAANRPDVCAAVSSLYADLQRDIDARRPLCTASGRCCHFDAYGHRLYVTTIELAAFVHSLHEITARERVPASSRRQTFAKPQAVSLAVLTPAGSCAFQREGLCTVHSIRPFGCRIFFCDATSTDWQHERYAHYHARLKQLHAVLNVPYRYLEWRQALAALDIGTEIPARIPAGSTSHLSFRQLPF